MAVFSTNQVRQLYVVNAHKATIAQSDAAGTIQTPNTSAVDRTAYFKYRGVDGIMCSDFVDKANITYAKATPFSKLAKSLATYKINTTAAILTNGAGQEAIVRVTFRDYIGVSPEYQMQKYGSAIIKTGMTESDFYKEMAISLATAGKDSINHLFTVYLLKAAVRTKVDPNSKVTSFTDTYTGIIIEEAPQDWILGVKPQVSLNFVPQIVPIEINGISESWGTVAVEVPTISPKSNGIIIADLEYFCMGERGDIYRNVGFPRVLHTKYLVDPTKDYNMIDIEFYYKGEGNAVQESKKLVSLAILAEGETIATKAALTNTIIGVINTAFGTTIATLPIA